MRVSVELVPRGKETFINELKLVKTHFPSVDTVNIPDITRYEITSLEASTLATSFFSHVIPHLRAISVDKNAPLPFKKMLVNHHIKEVLIILGDPTAQNTSHQFIPCSTLDLIKKFKQELPKIKVYAGLDPYRASFLMEWEYIEQKIDAGAEGFFTQPFFDLHLLERYLKKLSKMKVETFWGVSPVVSPRSKHYWESRNNVKFPPQFQLTLKWNQQFAKMVIRLIKNFTHSHIYFMPIKMDIVEYLTGIIEG